MNKKASYSLTQPLQGCCRDGLLQKYMYPIHYCSQKYNLARQTGNIKNVHTGNPSD